MTAVASLSHRSPLFQGIHPQRTWAFPVPANSVLIQAVVEIMAVKGKKCFIREQRQGKVFIRMTLAVCSVFSQGLG